MVLDALVTLVLTFGLVAFGFCLTLHLAARYVLGPVRKRLALVGIAPAFVVFVLTLLGHPGVGAFVALIVDFVVIRAGYDLDNRTAGVVTIIHYSVSVILAFSIRNIVVLLAVG